MLEFEDDPIPETRALVVADPPPISQALGGFDIEALLTFLPDVRLKAALDVSAEQALAIDVQKDGVAAADRAVADLRAQIKRIEQCFEAPTSLANQLHKRMTGLRSDFIKAGSDAASIVGTRIVAEQRRLKAIEDDARRKAQEEADRIAREQAARAAEAAQRQQAPPAVVERLQEQAKTATAPPVASPRRAPTLASSTVVEKWRGRFKGCEAEAVAQPETSEMSVAQLHQLRALLQAILDGTAPTTAIQVDWSYVNRRAAAEKTTFAIAGLEAYDEGGLRGKARR